MREENKIKWPSVSACECAEARRSYSSYLKWRGGKNWLTAPHITLMAETIQSVAGDAARGNSRRVIFCLPPRHSKSETGTRIAPSWIKGRFPEFDVMLISYGADLAMGFSRVARDIFQHDAGPLFGYRVDPLASGREEWAVQKRVKGENGRVGWEPVRGCVFAMGCEGAVTGKGANVLLVDDLIKGPKEANSSKMRDALWDTFRAVLYSRLEPGAAVIFITTRWHRDDIAGRLVKMSEEESIVPWEMICLPAIAGDNDPLGRAPGEALWPDRYPLSRLREIENVQGRYYWHALYQQDPLPEEGEIFKTQWFRYFREEEEYYRLYTGEGERLVEKRRCWKFQYIDTAATEKELSDYFVIMTFVVTPEKELLILDIVRLKAETTKHEELLVSAYHRFGPDFQMVENKTFGLALVQGARKRGLPIRPGKAEKDKVSRARVAAARYETGNIYHLEGEPWLTALESELLDFPSGDHDDQVDCVSGGAIEVGGEDMFFADFSDSNRGKFAFDPREILLRGWHLDVLQSALVLGQVDELERLWLFSSYEKKDVVPDRFLAAGKTFTGILCPEGSTKEFSSFEIIKEYGKALRAQKITPFSRMDADEEEEARVMRLLIQAGRLMVSEDASDLLRMFVRGLTWNKKHEKIEKSKPHYAVFRAAAAIAANVFGPDMIVTGPYKTADKRQELTEKRAIKALSAKNSWEGWNG